MVTDDVVSLYRGYREKPVLMTKDELDIHREEWIQLRLRYEQLPLDELAILAKGTEKEHIDRFLELQRLFAVQGRQEFTSDQRSAIGHVGNDGYMIEITLPREEAIEYLSDDPTHRHVSEIYEFTGDELRQNMEAWEAHVGHFKDGKLEGKFEPMCEIKREGSETQPPGDYVPAPDKR